MHRRTYGWLSLMTVLGCQPMPQAAAAAQSPSRDDGRIPITTRSQEARALFLRGRALNENLQTHEAYAMFQRALALDTTFAFAEYSLASTSPTAKERDAHLQRALARSTTVSAGERLVMLGLQKRAAGDPEGARQVAESLVVRYPRDARAHWILANALTAQQRYDEGIAEFRAAIALDATYALAWNQLGYAYRSAGRVDSAETAFLRYIALVPADPNPYDSYAELLMKAGRFDESIEQYRKALAIDPHFSGSFIGIAANEMLAGRYDGAVAEAERYVRSARDDGERRTALLTLALVHVDHGATVKALRAMERRAAIAGAIADTVNMSGDGVLIAHILLEAGRPEAARDRFALAHALLAVSGASDDVKRDDALGAHYDAARVALAKGNVAQARAEAIAYAAGANARQNDFRVRQSHELNGLIALAADQHEQSLAEFALADQQNPAVLHGMALVNAAHGNAVRARELDDQARHLNILPTFPYVFTRASLAAATRSVTSGNAGGTQH